jgi:predicted AAA+ superfamily ATPase
MYTDGKLRILQGEITEEDIKAMPRLMEGFRAGDSVVIIHDDDLRDLLDDYYELIISYKELVEELTEIKRSIGIL